MKRKGYKANRNHRFEMERYQLKWQKQGKYTLLPAYLRRYLKDMDDKFKFICSNG